VNLHLVLSVTTLPALTLGAGGVVLWATRGRAAALAAVLTALLLVVGLAAFWAGHDTAGRVVFVGALELPGALTLVLYPRVRRHHAVDFCSLVLVVGAGVLGTAYSVRSSVGGSVGGSMVVVLVLTLIVHVWWRFELSDEDDRLAILWTVLALCTAGIVVGLCWFLTSRNATVVVGAILFATVGPAMAVGVRRPRLIDVRALIVHVVVLGVVFIVYVALFVGLVAILDMLGLPHPSTGVLAIVGLLAATTFHPLRVMLRGVIDAMLFGDRPDPLDAVTKVVDRVGDDPVLALRAIREALVLPYASLSVEGTEVASSGSAVTYTRTLPLRLGDDTVAEIVVGLRPGDLTLSSGDEHVLRIVAPLLAQTLRARALADDLRVSRGLAIAVIEEERRRLRRDLHDDLGPTLSGIAFTADAARNTLRQQPESAELLLLSLRADAVAAVAEIRRLVYDMRPPALDELGLVPALRQQAARVRTPGGRAIRVDVSAPDVLPQLPAAVEAAAYRISLEALTNAARHSGSDTASLRILIDDDRLHVSIRDAGADGGPWPQGVGLASMRERAAEVGGTLTITPGEGGALVEANLPLI
jgi:two-component system NarL family sensor kinase